VGTDRRAALGHQQAGACPGAPPDAEYQAIFAAGVKDQAEGGQGTIRQPVALRPACRVP